MSTDVPARTGPPGLFRAFWRWHFYASFLVIPVFALLAVTGLIYLFRFQLEPVLHHDLMRASAPAGEQYQQPLSAQLAAAQKAHPSASFSLVREGRGANDTNAFSFTNPDGSTTDVYVDPWRSKVLGTLDPDTTVSGYAVRLHGDLMAGRWGDGLIEVAACWAIVMALTGYALFFSGRKARLRRMARAAKGAATRHRHGLIGAVTGIGLLAMVVTGLPWTGFWGAKVQELATSHGSSLWSTDPGATSEPASRLDESLPHSHAVEVPWAQQDGQVPSSGPERRSVADVDTAVVVAEKQGLAHPFSIVLPSETRGVYSVMGDAFGDPTKERTVHVDRYSGQVRASYGFADYPAAAQVVSQGIGVHEGRSFGVPNMIASAAFCVLVLALCVTGPVMWWRRRPSRSLGAPRGRLPVRSTWWLSAGLVVLGVLLPLFGATLLAVLLLDQLVIRRFAAPGRWFSTG
ncbi:PepSY-associated TM helix domain-containing protein [Nocardioides marmorisolisilvae]|uniref:PepSY domain-containing protein n=1 Tax=Nocardioides marmorisolisilvae TaxID=1542737 RepID=A0A3N0DWZ0_9ACTN|nr:PepSY domain-containing protein [Nocardioides marmorisolisilvae]RNL80115.1 PepSY domain-containing protein [Nocardioides marmorisolisilvae]